MPHDIAPLIYSYLARDWRLANDDLTPTKCRQLRDWIPELRSRYQRERRIPYHQQSTRRAYLASFAPRYAYTLYFLLNRIEHQCADLLAEWHTQESLVICLLGGGPACEVFGLMDWLHTRGIEPRFLHVVLVDRERYWRSFHSYLFSELISRFFRRTIVIPSYEEVDFPDSRSKMFSRESLVYPYGQHGLLSQSRIVAVSNCLSEIPDHRGFACHLRYLLRLAWNDSLFLCADSFAKKRRPRMSWLENFFDDGAIETQRLFTGKLPVNCSWLGRDDVTDMIFPVKGGPTFMSSIDRWAFARLVHGSDGL